MCTSNHTKHFYVNNVKVIKDHGRGCDDVISAHDYILKKVITHYLNINLYRVPLTPRHEEITCKPKFLFLLQLTISKQYVLYNILAPLPQHKPSHSWD